MENRESEIIINESIEDINGADAVAGEVIEEAVEETATAEGVSEEDLGAAEKVNKGSALKEWLREILIAMIIALAIMQFIKPTIVKQRSMEPNFYTNDYLLVSKQAYGLFGGTPARGDVIVFRSGLADDDGASKLLIKRVIGLPGESITITDGKVYVDGVELEDRYTKDGFTNGEIQDLIVPEESLFCMGDNRTVSVDSRSPDVGFISYDDIVGKVVFRLFPFNEIGGIMNPYGGN